MQTSGKRARVLTIVVMIVCAAFVATLVAIVSHSHHSDPRQTRIDGEAIAARHLKSEAEAFAASGRPVEAMARYRDLESAAAISIDPQVKLIFDDSRAGRVAVEQMIAARMQNRVQGPLAGADVDQSKTVLKTLPVPIPRGEGWGKGIQHHLPGKAITSQSAATGARVVVPQTQPSPVYVRKPLQPLAPAVADLTDEQIGEAIRKGVNFLMSGGHRQAQPLARTLQQMPGFGPGEDALVLYALLQCGQAIDDPRLNPHDKSMDAAIARLKQAQFGHYQTYGRSVRCAALSLFNRPQDRATLKSDVAWLVLTANNGAYTYEAKTDTWDNSNSQYGLLGVWCGAETGIEVPDAYWRAVDQHWTGCQLSNGQWRYKYGYSTEAATTAMTCAGVASIFVTHDYLDSPKYGEQVGRDPFTPALRRGLDWLETADNCIDLQPGKPSPYRDWGYNLYGIERVGLASGFKYFGSHDWFRELAKQVIAAQLPDGSWPGQERIDTSYMLLFLARGRHPILMNKLRFNMYWANRPRDTANLARFASHELERQFNWQVVPLTHDWMDWTDSPVLYISSHKPILSLDDADAQKIRQFVLAGGLLFTQADGDSPEFDAYAHTLARRLFPEYEMIDVPADHPIYSVAQPVRPTVPLKMVSNGSRILMLHSPMDISKYWQRRDTATGRRYFALGLNIFVYAAGKQDFRNRLTSTYLPPVDDAPVQTIDIARLKYSGAWDPEPYTWTRFARAFQRNTGYALKAAPIEIVDLQPATAPIAHLTGAFDYTFNAAQIEALRRYVESGGVLLIDPCGGMGAFEHVFRDELLPRAFPGVSAQVVPGRHPLLSAGPNGMRELGTPKLRRSAVEILGSHSGNLMELQYGRGHVLFASLDITSGLLGTNTWGIAGFAPEYSQALMQNIILWTLDGQRD